MIGSKDTSEAVRFMTLFHRLRDWIDDDPSGLDRLASSDEALTKLCDDLWFAATILQITERQQRDLFAAPSDPAFISLWRDYESRYSGAVASVCLSSLGLPADAFKPGPRDRVIRWNVADDQARARAKGVEDALEFAQFNIDQDHRHADFPEGFVTQINDGLATWDGLKDETGFDLRGVFRRRELVPFVLVPRHVSERHGSAEKLSLFELLRQAHDSFVFGVPFAALALMRSILEVTLREHYEAEGDNLASRINNCRALPPGAPKVALLRLRQLANNVLHGDKNQFRVPQDLEHEVLWHLLVLRALIEGAPVRKLSHT